MCPNFLQKAHWRRLYKRLVLLVAGLAISHFFSQVWDLVVTAAVVLLLGPACGAGDSDAKLLCVMLGAILALRISLSSIISTTGIGVVDCAARFQEVC